MRSLAIVSCALTAALSSVPAFGQTTLQGVIGLKRAGLDDTTLVQLIQTDGSVFRLSTADVKRLRDGGVSDGVIVAMLQTSLPQMPLPTAPPEPAATEPVTSSEPPVDVTAVPDVPPAAAPHMYPSPLGASPSSQPVTTTVVVPVPVYVPVYLSHSRGESHQAGALKPAQNAAPEYWGYGGQRRPGTWQDPGVPASKPAASSSSTSSASAGGKPSGKPGGGQ